MRKTSFFFKLLAAVILSIILSFLGLFLLVILFGPIMYLVFPTCSVSRCESVRTILESLFSIPPEYLLFLPLTLLVSSVLTLIIFNALVQKKTIVFISLFVWLASYISIYVFGYQTYLITPDDRGYEKQNLECKVIDKMPVTVSCQGYFPVRTKYSFDVYDVQEEWGIFERSIEIDNKQLPKHKGQHPVEKGFHSLIIKTDFDISRSDADIALVVRLKANYRTVLLETKNPILVKKEN